MEINPKGKILEIKRKLDAKEINILYETYIKDKNIFEIKYDFIYKKRSYYSYSKDYNAILLQLDHNNKDITLFWQKSIKFKDQQNYILNYKISQGNNELTDDLKLVPIFLIILFDQKFIAKNSFKSYIHLLLQSLPVGSYYQLISDYFPYDKTPKEYNIKNVKESFAIIKGLIWESGYGTDMTGALDYIYNSKNNYEKITLPKHIFFITDGNVYAQKETLNLIGKLSHVFSIHSFGDDIISSKPDFEPLEEPIIYGAPEVSEVINKPDPFGGSTIDNIDNPDYDPFDVPLSETINSNESPKQPEKRVILEHSEEFYAKEEDFIKKVGIIGKGNYHLYKYLYNLKKYMINDLNEILTEYIYHLDIKSTLDKNASYKINFAKDILKPYTTNQYGYITKESFKQFDFTFKYIQNNNPFLRKYKINPVELPPGDELSKIIIHNYILNEKNLSEDEKINLAIKYQVLIEGTSLYAETELDKKNFAPMQFIGVKKTIVPKIDDEQDLFLGSNSINNASKKDDLKHEENKNKKNVPIYLFGSKYEIKCRNKEVIQYDYPAIIEKNLDEDLYHFDFEKILGAQNVIEGCWDIKYKNLFMKEKIYDKEFNALKDKKIDDVTALTIMIILTLSKFYKQYLDESIMIVKKAKIYIKNKIGDSYENIVKKLDLEKLMETSY
jgi:hypothetical protein